MDFSNRNTQHVQSQSVPANGLGAGAAAGTAGNNRRGNRGDKGRWNRIGFTILGAAIVILLIAIICLTAFGGAKSEDSYVDTSKLQAVFLNTGQVYFGNVKALNSKYFVLTNIYYLQTANSSSSSSSTSNSSNNVTLVKLGCELHMPYDQMVINSDQVTFWENLQSDGQVAKAVATFQKDNPNGLKCSDQSSSSASTTNSVQSAPSSSSTGNSSSSTGTSSNP